VNESGARLLRKVERCDHRCVVVRLLIVDTRAELPDTFALHLGRIARDEYRRPHAELLGGIRDTEAMITGGRRNDPSRAVCRRQRSQDVRGSPDLERSGPLLVLELQEYVDPGMSREPVTPDQPRPFDVWRDPVGRAFDCCGTR
jgi:hypothetical protein